MTKPLAKLIVWICNIAVAVLSVLAIVCYFFAPFWEVSVTYSLKPDDLKSVIPQDVNVDPAEILGEDGLPIGVSLQIHAADLFHSFGGDAEAVVEPLIDNNVKRIVSELTGTLNGVIETAVRVVAKNTVKDEVHSNVQKYIDDLVQGDSSIAPDTTASQVLEDLGITEDYIGQKTNDVIDAIYDENATVDSVTDTIMDTVDTLFEDLSSNAAEHEQYSDFTDFELAPETREEIESNVRDTLTELAAEDGSIDPQELIDRLLKEYLSNAQGSGGSTGKALPAAPLAAEEGADGEGAGGEPATPTPDDDASLDSLVKDFVMKLIPAQMSSIIVYAMWAMLGTMVLSMLTWIYILIKLIVKLATGSENPTVKLALPIWLGWLPYLIFAGIPSIAFLLLPTILGNLSGVLPPELANILGSMQVNITSIGWVALLCAAICFAISIFYMVMRRKFKKWKSEGEYGSSDAPQEQQAA